MDNPKHSMFRLGDGVGDGTPNSPRSGEISQLIPLGLAWHDRCLIIKYFDGRSEMGGMR